MYCLESSLQPKGPKFNPFPNYFLSTNEMDEKIYKTFKLFLSWLPLRNNFLKQKKIKYQSQASSPWSKKSSLMKKYNFTKKQ
jgi:hypothetical protein